MPTTLRRADYLMPDCWWRKHLESTRNPYEVREKIIDGESYLYIVPEKTDVYLESFEENFKNVSIVYKAYRIFPENDPDKFMEDYWSFLKENNLFLFSYSAEDSSVAKAYMLNLGVKILDKTVLGKPYIRSLCGYGQKIEALMLKTPEAKELKRKWSEDLLKILF
jgi:hypothetical protein